MTGANATKNPETINIEKGGISLMLYNAKNVIKVGDLYYEKMENHPQLLKYRFFKDLNSDNYDYVENDDFKMIQLLDLVFSCQPSITI